MAPKKDACKPKAKKTQKGGFELAGVAAVGALLFAEEVVRRRVRKGKKTQRGGADIESITIKYYSAGEYDTSAQVDKVVTSDNIDADDLALLKKFVASADQAATAAEQVAAEQAAAVEQEPAVVPAAEEEAFGGARRKSRKTSGKKTKAVRGGGIADYLTAQVSTAQQAISKGMAERFEQIGETHAAMLPPVIGILAPATAESPLTSGGARRKKGKRMSGGDDGSCAHIGLTPPAATTAPTASDFTATFTGSPASIAGGGKSKRRQQRGGSFPGVLGAAMGVYV